MSSRTNQNAKKKKTGLIFTIFRLAAGKIVSSSFKLVPPDIEVISVMSTKSVLMTKRFRNVFKNQSKCNKKTGLIFT